MELILESDSDAHSSEDEDISPQSISDRGNTTDTKTTQWTDNTNCQLTVPVVYQFTQGPSGLQQTEAPHINKESSPPRVFMLYLFWNYTTGVEETNR
jgi:hypothetical protein